MPEFDQTPNHEIFITDPTLRSAFEEYQSQFQKEMEMLNLYGELAANIGKYNTYRIAEAIWGPDQEFESLGTLAERVGEFALDLSVADVVTPTGPAARVQSSKLSQMLGKVSEETMPDQLEAALIGTVKNWTDDSNSVPAEPIILVKGVLPVIDQIKSVGQRRSQIETALPRLSGKEWLTAQVAVTGSLPSKDSLASLAGFAYLDTARALAMPMSIPGLINSDDRKNLMAHGDTQEQVMLFEAAQIIDMAQEAVTQGLGQETTYSQALAVIAGLSRSGRIRTSMFANTNIDKLPPAAQLLYNAQSIMAAVHSVKSSQDEIVQDYAADTGVVTAGAKDYMRSSLERIPTIVRALRGSLLDRLGVLPGDALIEDEAVVIEASNAVAMQVFIGKAVEVNLITSTEARNLHGLFDTPLAKQLKIEKEAAASAARQEQINEVVLQLTTLEQPYAYTAKKVRRFDGGTDLTRDLRTELAGKQLLSDDESAQALAMLILLGNAAKDKQTFFQLVNSTRTNIEPLLRDLRVIDPKNKYQSGMVNVLHWIDEIVDAGEDVTISNSQLKQFIYEYYVGPDVNVPVASPVEERNDTEVAPEPEVDVPINGLGLEVRARRKAALDVYTSRLAELLQAITIPHVDVNAFPPSKSNRNRREQQKQSLEKNASFVDVDPNRLENLIRLKNRFEEQGHVAELMFTNPTSWRAIPPFVLYVRNAANEQQGICLVENPINGNASYVFAVDGALVQSWPEIVELPLDEARTFGARAFVHPPKDSFSFDQHYSLKLLSHMNLTLGDLKNN